MKKRIFETLIRSVARSAMNEGMMIGEPLFDDMPSTEPGTQGRCCNDKFEFMHALIDHGSDNMAPYGAHVAAPSSHVLIIKVIDLPKGTHNASQQDRMDFQKALNEADKSTNVWLETGWAGNSGLFADKIVYSDARVYTAEDMLKNCEYDFEPFHGFGPFIDKMKSLGTDTTEKGIIAKVFSPRELYLKTDKSKRTHSWEEVKDKVVAFADSVAAKRGCRAKLVTGRRQCDGPGDYEAICLYRKGGDYAGMIRVNVGFFGCHTMTVAVPLAG